MRNKLFYGDNLDVLRRYVKDESVDLCYIDPPFNSKRNYNQIYNNLGKEDKAQTQAFIDTWTWDNLANSGYQEIITNYEGRFTEQTVELIKGLKNVIKQGNLLAYLVSMTLRITEIHRALKSTGSFYLHCDPTASHYLKLVLDAIFCAKGGDFRNEIIWGYIAPSAAKKDFPRKHDVIFRYTKSNIFTFNADAIRIAYSEEFVKRRKYAEGKSGIYAEKSSGRNDDEMKGFSKGKIPPSWWTDIKSGGQMPRSELLGYPTQKPETLLERIIKASSNEGDIILDAYCGCGTTVAVAEKLNRQWIGIDITYQSISLILKRLEEQNLESLINIELSGIPKDFDSAVALANKKDDRIRKEFEKWMVLTYSQNRAIINEKKGGDRGIDGIAYITHSKDAKETKKVIFSVKSNATLSPAVIRDLYGTVMREESAMGILLTLYPMPNLVKESKQYGIYHNEFSDVNYPKIKVVNVEEVLAGELMECRNIAQLVLRQAIQQYNQEDLL